MQPLSGTFTTTLLVPNLHCPSCVETIRQLLAPIKSISSLRVSILHHTITFTDSNASNAKNGKPGYCEVTDILQREGGFLVETTDEESVQLPVRSSSTPVVLWTKWLRRKLTREVARNEKNEYQRQRIHLARCDACRNGSSDTISPIEAKIEDVAMIKTTLSIAGMTCASCTQSIHTALLSQDDVVDVDINLLASSAVVQHRSIISSQLVKAIIEDAGFEAEITSSAQQGEKMRTTISIGGMTCASCSSAIDKALRGITGVDRVDIDVIGNRGVIVHAGSINAQNICETITQLGYDATIVSSESLAFRAVSKERTVTIAVKGIHCTDCITKLNARLSALPVKSTPFTMQDRATEITYTPREPLTIRDLLQELAGDGPEFEAEVLKETSLNDRSKDIQKRELRILSLNWVVAFIFAVPTFIIGIVGMVLLPSGNRFHEFTMMATWGAAKMGTIIVWPIATVVQFGVGRLFYQRALAPMIPYGRRLWAVLFEKNRHSNSLVHRWTWRCLFSFGSMDLLVVLSTTSAYLSSLAMMIIDVTSPSSAESVGSYFDSSVFLIMFILLGRVLEAYAKSRTTDAVSLLGQLRVDNALLVEDNSLSPGGPGADTPHTALVPVQHLEKGDLILVPPGSLPPTDGIVVSGQTTFDESSVTGESRPIKKGPGDEVFTGTTNLSGAVTIRITTTAGETLLEKIMYAVSEASGRKAPVERLAETLTGVFVPIIVYLAIIVLAVWLVLAGMGLLSNRRGTSGGEYFFAIEFAIATLVVACPCGIGLAVPCANAVGIGLVAKEGILATTGGEAFLGATKVGVIVLDKTGTMTIGKSTVTDTRHWPDTNIDEETVDKLVLEIERGSTHPLAQGILSHLDNSKSPSSQAETVSTKEIAGRGVIATARLGDEQFDVLIGNIALLSEYQVLLTPDQDQRVRLWSGEAKSIVLVAMRRGSSPYALLAAYALSDPPRETTASALKTLRELGVEIKMLSGDNALTAAAIGKMVGISVDDIFAGVDPEGKAGVIRQLQESLPSPRPSRFRQKISNLPVIRRLDLFQPQSRLGVMFVGDGINDSVALAAADVSVAMGHGSQAVLAGADFVLLSSTLSSLPGLLRISRRVTRRQKLNLSWACIFNIICLPFAAGVFYPAGGIRLTPVWSAVVMACSSLSVVCSSLALRWGI